MRNALQKLGALGVGLVGSVILLMLGQSVISMQVPVSPGYRKHVFVNLWDRGYFSADGTWTMEEERMAFPIQRSKIICRREEQTCTVAHAEVTDSPAQLFISIDRLPIQKWDKDTIIYTNEAQCVDFVYTASRLNERIVGTRTTKLPVPEGCIKLQQKPIHLTLADGFDVLKRLQSDASSKTMPFIWMSIGALWLGILVWMRRAKPRGSGNVGPTLGNDRLVASNARRSNVQ